MPPQDTTANAADQTAQQQPTPTGDEPSATPQPDASAQPGESWEDRFKGMQRAYGVLQQTQTQTMADLQQTRTAAEQAQANATAAQQELQTAQATVQGQSEQIAALQTQGAEAMREAAYWGIVNQEYPELAPIAASIQRAESPEAQRQIFEGMRQALGGIAQRGAQQVVQQTLQGVTPTGGGAPAATQQGPDYGTIIEHTMDPDLYYRDRATYDAWMEYYRTSELTGPASLHGETFVDPFANDFQAMRERAGREVAPLNQTHGVQQMDTGATPGATLFSQAPQIGPDGTAQAPQPPGAAPAMPNAYGGTRPPGQ